MKEKIFCVFFGLFLALVATEIFLRLLGLGYNLTHQTPVDRGADYRILCVGESTTWGVGASNPLSKGYPHQLEGMLNRTFKEIKVQCFFDQTIGQNTSEILLKLPQYIRKYRPQLIVFMVGANNWWNMDKSNVLLFNKNPASRVFLKVLIFLDKFRVWKLFKSVVLPRFFVKEHWNYFFPSTDSPEAQKLRKEHKEIGYDLFNEIGEYDMGEMVKICKRNGIKVILCNYPKDSGQSSQKNNAEKFGTPFVDNYSSFQTLKDPKAYFSTDFWHPNDQGYALVAENIYRCILENKFIK